MATDLQHYLRLKQRYEESSKEITRLEGILERLLEEAQETYDCSTLEELEALQVRSEKEFLELQAECDELVKALEKKWQDKL